ncbi:MAG: TraB/GumN family protein [Saprospiraceae bacterium]
MRKGTITILTLVFLGNFGFSRVSSFRDTLETKTVLYKVIHPDHLYVSYLFGTHHAFGKPFFDSLIFAREALLSSSILIKENLNIPGHLAEDIINQRTRITKWKKYLDKADFVFIQSLFSSGNLDFNKMTPAELSAFLSRYYKERICIGKDLAARYFSLDDYIGLVAEENHIQVIGLETTEEQISLINNDLKGMPRKIHKKRLGYTIDRIRNRTQDNCSEIEWYRQMNFDFKLSEPCRNSLVLGDRNEKWMVQIKDLFVSQNCFVAVGLSHLMFECGLISKLKASGYVVIPIEVRKGR